jgi:hypothetical protein
MDRDWTASFLIQFRNGICIIILDEKYNIANSSCHFGSYGPVRHQKNIIWTSEASVHHGWLLLTNKHILFYSITKRDRTTTKKSSVGDFTFYNEWDILQFVEMIFSRVSPGYSYYHTQERYSML